MEPLVDRKNPSSKSNKRNVILFYVIFLNHDVWNPFRNHLRILEDDEGTYL